MKRISQLGALLVLLASFNGCVIHHAHIDPFTGCRTGCSIEAVPDGPLDCCFYVRILKCPLFPWNWGQYLCCDGICDVPACGPHGCGVGPAYPPMLTGGCCDIGCGTCDTGACGVPHYGDMGYPVAPLAGGMGGCCSAPGGMPMDAESFGPAMPSYPPYQPGPHPHHPMRGQYPMPGQHPMQPAQPPMPMPGNLGEPMPNPQTFSPPASLMAPTSYVSPMSYVAPASFNASHTPRVNSPYTAPRALPVMPAAQPISNQYPVVAPR